MSSNSTTQAATPGRELFESQKTKSKWINFEIPVITGNDISLPDPEVIRELDMVKIVKANRAKNVYILPDHCAWALNNFGNILIVDTPIKGEDLQDFDVIVRALYDRLAGMRDAKVPVGSFGNIMLDGASDQLREFNPTLSEKLRPSKKERYPKGVQELACFVTWILLWRFFPQEAITAAASGSGSTAATG